MAHCESKLCRKAERILRFDRPIAPRERKSHTCGKGVDMTNEQINVSLKKGAHVEIAVAANDDRPRN